MRSSDIEMKLGPNCYWNNWLTTLQLHGISEYALAFVNFGCVYTGRDLAKFIENEDDETIRWIFEAVQLLELPFTYETIEQASSPLLLTLDIYHLGLNYPAYLREHERHILNICGIENGYYQVVDNHYGFSGLVDPKTIDAAASSDKINGCGRLTMLNPLVHSAAEEHALQDKLKQVFKRKIEYYLDGVYLPDVPYPGGVRAISLLKEELPELVALYNITSSPQYRWLSIRLNQYFRYPREGILNFFRMHANTFSLWIQDDLMNLLAESAELMRKLILKVLVGQMGAQPLQDQFVSLMSLLHNMEAIEERISGSLRLLHRSIG